MGHVYRARDTRLHREVALKVLPPADASDPAARERLLREARSGAALSHPNICSVFDVGEAGDQAFIAMERVEGTRLDEKLAAGALPAHDVFDLGGQIAAALDHAHDAGIVHRDLKCANVMVTGTGQVKVLDFGIAVPTAMIEGATRSRASITPAVAGTLPYMAPEILGGTAAATPRNDICPLV
jgi:serine/threonine protein kinase